jgi:hypothetical protein
MVARVVAFLGIALVIAGCVARETAKSSAFAEGSSVHTISVGGHRWPDFATEKLWQFFAAYLR